jgi:serine phosphatase RsbU (regulator of sigma subunit)
VITWVAGDTGRRFSASDVAFGEDLARRAAVAIDNSRLHTELREMAIRLQRAVLPAALPVLTGWEMAAHYSPTGDLDAGGDFYDVIDLGQGRVALFIGDVMGRGVHAAAAMAQMRSATRALVAVNPDPAAVLSRLDQVFERYDFDQLVTMFYAVIDTTDDTLVLANAGHLAPVIVRPEGEPFSVTVPAQVLLGAGGGDRSAATFPFGRYDTLLAFTDGLVERRHEDIDVGEARLREAARGLSAGPLASALTDLVKTVSDPDRDDDVAVLVVRRT